jgi:8-oxo-dGTP pyrophosphatase MutT (NUDIX family)
MPALRGPTIVDLADWVNVVALTASLDLIVVEQYRHAARQVTVEIPAGSVERADVPADAAARELQEEVGHAAASLVLVSSRYVNPALQSNVLHTYVVYPCKTSNRRPLDRGEQVASRSIPARVWREPSFLGSVRHLFTALALQEADREIERLVALRTS